MVKSKLKSALDAHKGVDYKHVKEKKKQKEAKKKRLSKEQRRAKAAGEDEKAENGASDVSDNEEEGGVLIDKEAVGTEIAKDEEKRLQAELKALLGNKKKLMEIDSGSEVDEEDEWESAAEDVEGLEEDDEEGSSEEEEQGVRSSEALMT
jgi:rRNA-processing protein EBP2